MDHQPIAINLPDPKPMIRRESWLSSNSTIMSSFDRFRLPHTRNMDQPWTFEDWKPTAPLGSIWHENPPKESVVERQIELIISHTKELRSRPYDALGWGERAKHLLVLGYPELAAGDAWKARLLCDAAQTGDPNHPLRKKVKSSQGMQLRLSRFFMTDAERKTMIAAAGKKESFEDRVAFVRREACYTIVCALLAGLSRAEALLHCDECRFLYPEDVRFTNLYATLSEKEDTLLGCKFIATKYPWMPEHQRKRSAATLEAASKQMELVSGGKCAIRESRMVRLRDDPDFYGVIATEDIPAHAKIFSDTTTTGVSNVSIPTSCDNCRCNISYSCFRHKQDGCNVRYCSTKCRDVSISYHKLLCGGSLDWLQAKAAFYKDAPPRELLFSRFLAAAVADKSHPLDHETAATLSAHYDDVRTGNFTMHDSIALVLRMLSDLGVDVYADLRFDTWVLIVLWDRIAANARVERYEHGGWLAAVNPCLAFVNHSCAPNARKMAEVSGTTVQVRSTRPIKKGEEICLSYLAGSAPDSAGEEAAKLEKLLGGPCKCEICAQ